MRTSSNGSTSATSPRTSASPVNRSGSRPRAANRAAATGMLTATASCAMRTSTSAARPSRCRLRLVAMRAWATD